MLSLSFISIINELKSSADFAKRAAGALLSSTGGASRTEAAGALLPSTGAWRTEAAGALLSSTGSASPTEAAGALLPSTGT